MSAALLTRFEDRIAPSRTALLVVDMQNDFSAEGGYIECAVGRSAAACRAIVPPLDALIAAARVFLADRGRGAMAIGVVSFVAISVCRGIMIGLACAHDFAKLRTRT